MPSSDAPAPAPPGGGGGEGEGEAEEVASDGSSSSDAEESSDDSERRPPSLPALLSALALGARAVNALPLPSPSDAAGGDVDSSDGDYEGGGGDGGDDGDSEFAFRMAFPEFASLCGEAREALADLLSESLEASASASGAASSSSSSPRYDFDDPLLWIRAADACDALLEEVDAHVEAVESGGGASASAAAGSLRAAAAAARDGARGKYRLMMEGLAEVEKPQIAYGFASAVDNGRLRPFRPSVHPSKPHAVVPLSESFTLKRGNGLATKDGDLAASKKKPFVVPSDVVAPSEHYPHPYRPEIEALEYRPWQLEVPDEEEVGRHGRGGTLHRAPAASHDGDGEGGKDGKKKGNGGDAAVVDANEGLWIDAEDDLRRLAERIRSDETVREIAVDLEAHSYRTFSGFVCLMQISLRRPPPAEKEADLGLTPVPPTGDTIETASDFLIDALALRGQLNRHLAPIFADPDVVKVMHGADMDVRWLQRDFGIYVVNLFDTCRAARRLISSGRSELLPPGTSAGLAALLSRVGGIDVDKRHQMSDWRRRPLPSDMRTYAASDTTHLLDAYDVLRVELERAEPGGEGVRAVLDESRGVCLLRYDREPFYPSRYKGLLRGRRNLDGPKKRALKALYDWRDRVARDEDESVQYVCPDAMLVRLSAARPRTVAELRDALNPVPPLVAAGAEEVLDLVRQTAAAPAADEATAAATAAKRTSRTAATSSSTERISQLRASASPFAFRPASGTAAGGDIRADGPSAVPPRPPPSSGGGGSGAAAARGGMMSPVVGTEALYRQAGWMTPEVASGASGGAAAAGTAAAADSSSGEEDDGGKKSERLLNIDKANEGYVASAYTKHSLEMTAAAKDAAPPPPPMVDEEQMENGRGQKERRGSRGRTVDGLGAARAALARREGESPPGGEGEGAKERRRSVEDEARSAREGAVLVRAQLARGEGDETFLPTATGFEGGGGDGDGTARNSIADRSAATATSGKKDDDGGEEDGEEEEFSVPRSMREIYRISNRNRHRAGKGGKSSAPPSAIAGADVEGAEDMDVDTAAGADAVLAARGREGRGYFGGGGGAGAASASASASADGKGGDAGGRAKRQRTKGQEGGDGAAGVGAEEEDELGRRLAARADDVAAMEGVGWIGGREEVRDLLAGTTAARGGDRGGGGRAAAARAGKDGSAGAERGGGAEALSSSSSTAAPFDYSKIGAIGAYGPMAPPPPSATGANPFFAGAAVRGAPPPGVPPRGGSGGGGGAGGSGAPRGGRGSKAGHRGGSGFRR